MGRKKTPISGKTEAKREETTVSDVLRDAKNTDFTLRPAREEFQRKHEFRLTRSSLDRSAVPEEEILHHVARERRLDKLEPFTVWAIKTHRSLLDCRMSGGMNPLHLAIAKRNHEFVGLVLHEADRIGDLLMQQTNLGLNCLHLAIKHSSPFTEFIIAKVRDVDMFTATSRDKEDGTDKMTPLHLAVTMEPETEMDDQAVEDNGIALNGHQAFDTNQAQRLSAQPTSANGERAHFKRPNVKTPGPSIRKRTNSQADSYLNATHEAQTRSKEVTVRWLGRNSGSEDPDPRTNLDQYTTNEPYDDIADPRSPKSNHSPTRVTGHGKHKYVAQSRPFDPSAIVRELIEAYPSVLTEDYRDCYGDTPFQARLAWLQDPDNNCNTAEEDRDDMIDKDPVLCYIREYIISNFDRKDAMKALYKVGDERVLEFDLSGLPYSTINTEFLNGLGKVLRFEGLLKYVALPRLTVEDDGGRGYPALPNDSQRPAKGGKMRRGKGLQHMLEIFDWLRERRVKSVLKVTVIDDVEPSHSDAAIESCVEGLNIRTWNWYKLDLSSHVIPKSVRDVTLYSSGNNAVLMGWSSPLGLPSLPELSRVHVCVREGLDDRRRVEQYIKTFEEVLKKQKLDIEFTKEFRMSDQKYTSVFMDRGSEKLTESKWMKSMRKFADFLRKAKPEQPVEPVRIAVIDDGINTALFADKIQVGESFYQLSELSGARGAYYVPSGPHGTLMAQLICDVCPMVKLYIAQLEVLPGLDGRRSFTAESAAEAITWAVNQGVDIISMSWSINSRDVLTGLQNALIAANNSNIMMFCASIDEGATATDRTYPGRSGLCIKIGASTGTGARLSWVSESNSDFLLPGEALQPAASSESNPWGKSHLGSFGSSVSTALATGLAGTLLYCDRLLNANASAASGSESPISVRENPSTLFPVSPGTPAVGFRLTEPAADFLRNPGNMKNAFANLSKGTEANKFPQVWDYLPSEGPDAEELIWNPVADPDRTEKTKAKVEEFMKTVEK